MYALNQDIANTYRSGYPERRCDYLRLDLNENPGGLPQEFIDEVLAGVTPEFVSQYPEMAEFERKYAAFLGIEREELCLTNGSTEGIRYVIEGYTLPGGKIVGVTPTYAMYEVYANMYGREFMPVSYGEDLKVNVDDVIAATTPDVQLLILLNPNNPVGDAYSDEDMARIMDAAFANEVTVLIDEAYHYLYPSTFMHYALEHDNVFVTRTFSKLFSLAGLRLGCVVGRAQGIDIVRKLCVPHNVNAFAIRFAQAIIERPQLIDQLIAAQADGKAYLEGELDRRGYDYVHSNGNFMFFKPRINPDVLVERMKDEAGILVKSYKGIGRLGHCMRLTTAERRFMQQFVEALDKLDR